MNNKATILLNTFDPPAPGTQPPSTQVISRSFGVDDPEAMRRAEAEAGRMHSVGDACPGGHRPAEGPIRERLERVAVARRRNQLMETERKEKQMGLSSEERGRMGGRARWAGHSPEQRSEQMRQLAFKKKKTAHRHVFTPEEAQAASKLAWERKRAAGRAAATAPGDRMIGLAAAAGILGVSRGLCEKMIHAGLMEGFGDRPGLKRPKKWTVRLSDVIAVLTRPPRVGIFSRSSRWNQAAGPAQRLVVRISLLAGEKRYVGRRVVVEIPLTNGSMTAAGAAKRIVAALGQK